MHMLNKHLGFKISIHARFMNTSYDRHLILLELHLSSFHLHDNQKNKFINGVANHYIFWKEWIIQLNPNIVAYEKCLTELYDLQGSNPTFNTAVLPKP